MIDLNALIDRLSHAPWHASRHQRRKDRDDAVVALVELREIIRQLLPYADNHWDEGPIHEGWQSDKLVALIKRANAIFSSIELPPEPSLSLLREVVDQTWMHAFEDQSVPSTSTADKIIAKAKAVINCRYRPSQCPSGCTISCSGQNPITTERTDDEKGTTINRTR